MSTVNNQVTRDERAGTSSAIGNVPDVHAQTALTQTVTVTGTGTGIINVQDIAIALQSQNSLFFNEASSRGNMYIHEIRAYGVTGGYLSLAPYPHRQYVGRTDDGQSFFFNRGTQNSGALTQMYDFGVAGASRPHLKWTYPKNEILNNPLYYSNFIANADISSTTLSDNIPSGITACCVQSVNAGDALYILQFDVTIQPHNFLEIGSAFNAAAIDPDAITEDNYKGPSDPKKRKAESEKAMATANKKRKIKHTKDLTMPSRDV